MLDYTKSRQQQSAARVSAVDAGVDVGLRAYMLQVYNQMAGALALTGLVAYVASTSEALMQAIFGTPLAYVVMFAPVIFVLFFSARINKMSDAGARMALWGFSALMGLSLSYIFLAYTGASVVRVFFITAAAFGGLSLYGYTTKRDLGPVGTFLVMGAIGLFIAMIVNLFLQSAMMSFILSAAGVLIFAGLTAYDTQRVRDEYYSLSGDQLAKASVRGALTLYLDFINLMIFLLRFIGDRR